MSNNTYTEAQERIPNLRQQVLQMLINAGNKGVTNLDFQKLCVRWNSRLSELYSQGYKTDVVYECNGIYRYVLTEQPETISKHRKAKNILMDIIKKEHKNNISSEVLLHILDENNLNITRKSGTYKSNEDERGEK